MRKCGEEDVCLHVSGRPDCVRTITNWSDFSYLWQVVMYSIFDAEEPIPCHWSLLYPLKRRLLAKVDMEVRCSQEPGYPLEGIVITRKISIFFFSHQKQPC